MKLVIFALVMAVAMANIHTGYLNKLEEISQAKLEKYSLDSFTNLLRNNFQVLNDFNAAELIEEFGKGNLLNPIKMNYLFVVEGENTFGEKVNQAKIQIEKSGDKLLDQIFGMNIDESLVKLTAAKYPKEARVPFYYYKSPAVEQNSAYEGDFGIEIKKGQKSGDYNLFDQRTGKVVGKTFSLQQCIRENFAAAENYRFTRQGIFKKGDESMKLEVNEQNAQDVKALMQDLCAVSKISKLFKESDAPNFVSFALSYKSIQNNELVKELVEEMIESTEKNFQNNIGAEKVYGQTLFVNSLEEVQSEKSQSRILSAEGNFVALDSGVTEGEDVQIRQIQFWFSVVFIIILVVVSIQMVKMDVGKDTLLYAKFIASDMK